MLVARSFVVSLVASLRLNHESVVYSALASVATTWAAQVFFYNFPQLQGGVDVRPQHDITSHHAPQLPWWSIWLPLVFGGVGVVGFAWLEDRGRRNRDSMDALDAQPLLPSAD